MKSYRYLGKQKSSSRSTVELEGSKISVSQQYGGLGKRYYDKLGSDLDKILQVEVSSGTAETRGSVRGRGIQLALDMQERGIKQGDIIVISSSDNVNQCVVVLAILFLGAIAAPLDPGLSMKESYKLVKRLKPKMFFGDSRSIPPFERAFQMLNLTVMIVNFSVDAAGNIQFNKMMMHKEDELFKPVFIENPNVEVAFIVPTQGTTGLPKLVCLSHQNIYLQTIIVLDICDNPSKVMSFFPLSWYLQAIFTCACFEANITRIIAGLFTERKACKIIHDFAVSHAIFGTDYALRLATSVAARDYDMSCLKCIVIGSLNTTKHDIRLLKALMPHVAFLQCYSLTETGIIAATSMKNYVASSYKGLSVGKLSKNCMIKIVDLDTEKIVSSNVYGEVYYYGDGMMLGYFKDNDKTLASMTKNFFRTGDVAKYDEDGWLYVKGRVCDILMVEGVRHFPTDLEDAILMNPAVKDTVVIGKDSEILACVKLKPRRELTDAKLFKYLSEKIDVSKMPTKIIFMEHFPRTTVGSVKRNVLTKELLSVKLHYTTSLASIMPIEKSIADETTALMDIPRTDEMATDSDICLEDMSEYAKEVIERVLQENNQMI